MRNKYRRKNRHPQSAGQEFVNGYRTVELINKSGEGTMTNWLAIN
jgi:hypothetical protein